MNADQIRFASISPLGFRQISLCDLDLSSDSIQLSRHLRHDVAGGWLEAHVMAILSALTFSTKNKMNFRLAFTPLHRLPRGLSVISTRTFYYHSFDRSRSALQQYQNVRHLGIIGDAISGFASKKVEGSKGKLFYLYSHRYF